jgi:acyl carrier protein
MLDRAHFRHIAVPLGFDARRRSRNDPTMNVDGTTKTPATPSTEAIAAEVRSVVAEAAELPAGEVRADLQLEADLGVDSLAMIQIGVELEHALGFRAPDIADAASHPLPQTVGELIELVQAQIGPR